jgi:hypothetical protein
MLSLDDSRWKELQHCYGDAADVPDLLRDLASSTAPSRDHEDEPWFSLWSRLCHQGDAYIASYAAVPHIVHIASKAAGPIDFSFFQLPAAVEIARRTGRGPTIPDAYAPAYHQAIQLLVEAANLHNNEAWSRSMVLAVAAAPAAANGQKDNSQRDISISPKRCSI